MTWPGTPLPLPPLFRRASYELDPSGEALIGSGGLVRVRDRGGEIYLKLRAVGLHHPSKILEFARQYGALDGKAVQESLIGWDMADPEFSRYDINQTELAVGREFVASALSSAPAPFESEQDRFDFVPSVEITPLSSFRFAGRCLRDLVTMKEILSRPNLDRARLAFEARPDLTKASQDVLARFFGFALSALLPELKPFIRVDSTVGDEWDAIYERRDELAELAETDHRFDQREPATVKQATGGTESAALHQICALELYNHIVAGEVYRLCKKCGREFVLQEGRAQHGMSKRRGVLYCSNKCSNAHAQQELRKRQAIRAQKADPGIALEPQQPD